LNDQWAKGHVRLAASYIALGGGHSNDACNALQRALQLDPSNPTARDMLVRELRRDHNSADAARSSSPPSAPPQEQDDQDYDAAPPTPRRQQYQDQQAQPPIDDSITWSDRFQFYYHRTKSWYYGQSDDAKTVLKVFVMLVLLYVAFGGRFGFEGGGKKRGNYGAGNVYDQYYGRHATTESSYGGSTPQRTSSSSSYETHKSPPPEDSYRSSSSSSQYKRDDYYASDHQQPRRSSSRGGEGSSSFHFPNLLDGSVQSMMLLAGLAYVAHRNGINPLQAIFFLNMMGGGRRHRHRPMGGGMYGGGGGMGGFRGGGMRFGGRRRW
jgi:hypothetical protein